MKARIFLKLVLSFLAVILVVTALLDFSISSQFERTFTQTLRQGLEQKARLFSDWLGEVSPQALPSVVARAAKQVDARITVIQRDGKVLADSEADAGHMENHAHRPEFEAALRGEVGSSTRLSGTVQINFLYVAIPLHNGPWQGGALRLAYPLAELDRGDRIR